MSIPQDVLTEAHELIEAACGCRLNDEQLQRLETLVLNHASVRAYFVDYLDMHAQLRWAGRGPGQAILLQGESEGNSSPAISSLSGIHGGEANAVVELAGSSARADRKQPHRLLTKWRAFPFSYIAATLLLTLVFWNLFLFLVASSQQSPDRFNPHIADGPAKPRQFASPTVATLLRIHGAQWQTGAKRWRTGYPLSAGDRLDLARGQIEIGFADGSLAVLTGPARMAVDSVNGVTLDRGQLYVAVGEATDKNETATEPSLAETTGAAPSNAAASGNSLFTVKTPFAEIHDVGTRFGVLIDDADTLDVFVFKGSVNLIEKSGNDAANVQPDSTIDKGHPRHVEAGQRVRVYGRDRKNEESAEGQLSLDAGIVWRMPSIESPPLERFGKQYRFENARADGVGYFVVYEGKEGGKCCSKRGVANRWTLHTHRPNANGARSWVTPVIFRPVGENKYQLVGVGAPRRITSAPREFSFNLICGSVAMEPGDTVGFYIGRAYFETNSEKNTAALFSVESAEKIEALFQASDDAFDANGAEISFDTWAMTTIPANYSLKIGDTVEFPGREERLYSFTFTTAAIPEP